MTSTIQRAPDVPAQSMNLSGLTFEPNLRYAASSGADLRFDFYQGTYKPAGARREDPAKPPSTPTPVIIWVPPHSLEDFVTGANHVNVDSKFPTPIASYLGYGYAVVAASYAAQISQPKDLRLLIDHLTEHAEEYRIDADNIGVLVAHAGGYRASIARSATGGGDAELELSLLADHDYQQLLQPDMRRTVVEFYAAHLGGSYDAAYEPLDLKSPDVAWVDLIIDTHPLGAYRVFPTARRGQGTFGSYAVYLPPSYDVETDRRYPVIYFLHGGGGNQREARNWLFSQVDRLIGRGQLVPTIVISVQALPVGWFANGNQAADGVVAGPVEDVIMSDLVPHVDATYRTIATRESRGLEGFSAGGFGALRLAFKFPEVFGYASSLAGAVIDFDEEPNPDFIAHTFGPPDDPATRAYFDAVRPQYFAEHNADAIVAAEVGVRLVVGDGDWLYDKDGVPVTERMSTFLSERGIANEYLVIPGVDHMITKAFEAGQAEYPAEFWTTAFARYDTPQR